MSAQTLNIIYDTNYTSIVPDGGFVDHPFTKKTWFWDLLFWDLNKKWDKKDWNETSENSQTQPQTQAQTQDNWQQAQQPTDQTQQPAPQTQPVANQTQQAVQQNQQAPQNNQAKDEKKESPSFFDLLFGDLNSEMKKKKPEDTANQQANSNEQTSAPAQNASNSEATQQAPAVQENQTPAPQAEAAPTQTAPVNTDQQTSKPADNTTTSQATTSPTAQQAPAAANQQTSATADVTATNQTPTPQNPTNAGTLDISWKDIEDSKPKKKKSWIDSMLDSVFWPEESNKKEEKTNKADNSNSDKKEISPEEQKLTEKEKKEMELREQIKKVLEIPDSEYKDSMLTSDMRRFIKQVDEEYTSNMADFKSHIAPSYWEYKSNWMNISGILWKTYYTQRYPTYIDALWTRDIMTIHSKRDMSFFIYPEDDAAMQAMLKRKSTQLKAELNEAMSKWITIDKEVEQQYKDVELIREKLSTREERYFELSNYFTIYNTDEVVLKEEWKKFEQKIGGYGISVKSANHRMDEWMTSTLPLCIDDLWISRSALTSSLAWSFPFISNDLVQNTWIFYGLNLHTWWLIIMDRFSDALPNMNSVILATSWAWKSFTVKLEILRYLLNGIDIIVIDPENEYKDLCEAVGGTYINIATNAQQYINPFDLPPKIEDVEYGKWDLLRSQIMTLIWLIQILIWKLTPEEEAILDKALQNTYALRGFSFEEDDYEWKQPPLMEDLMNILNGMEWWEQVWLRLSKYVTGTFGKLFNNYTNVDINNRITVFSIRDLEEALKTPAMYNVLNFIWTKVRSTKRQRLLVCDEAWIMLQNDVSANFMFSMTKRARKYGLWITTISQDIEDFVRSPYWKPIVSNSSVQILLKQSTTSIKSLNQLLGLSEAEQQKLISCSVWEWLIFAWNQHIALRIVASPTEKELITTDVKKKNL